jgi:YidC/Oxa1 family membrane protein insertase
MFETLLTQPLYNGFVYLIDIMPGGDVGFAIIALTCVIRFLFYPVFASQIRSTMGMQAMQGELEEIKQKYKDDREQQSRLMLGLYKKYNVNPLSMVLSLFIQIPIFLALYFAFFQTTLPAINTNLLYPFVSVPELINIHFLGVLNLTLPHNLVLVAVVGALQYLVMRLSVARTNSTAAKHLSPEKLAAQKMQQNMMLYMLPGIIAVISYSLPAAVGLYFAAGSVISIGQEWLIRRQISKKDSK